MTKINKKNISEDDFSKEVSSDFDYESFKKGEIAKLYAGKGLSGKDGIFGNKKI